MKNSCLIHVPNDNVVIIRESFINITGDKNAGILLSYFEYWHNVKINMNVKNIHLNDVAEMHGEEGTQDISTLQYHTTAEIVEQSLGLLNKKSIPKAREVLKKLGFISEHKNPNPKYKFDKTIFFKLEIDAINNAIVNWGSSYTPKGVTVAPKRDHGNTQKDRAITETTSETTSEIKEKTYKKKNKPQKIYSVEFEEAWQAYGRKGSKKSAFKEWEKLTEEEKEKIETNIPIYRKSVSARKFMKDFERYLKHGTFEGEHKNNEKPTNKWADNPDMPF